jgi:aspartate aminotransferase
MTISRWTRFQLEAGGWIRRMFREGQRLRSEYGDDAVADLALGQPLEASEAVADAFRAATAERFSGRFEYMPNLGYDDVRERVAALSGLLGITAANIAMTQGAAAAAAVALRTFIDAGSDVIVASPFFPEFRLYVETASARFVPAGVRDDMCLDLEAIEAALSRNTSAVILNSPGNPTGHVLQHDELRELGQLLERHNTRYGVRVLLVVDEVYRSLIYPPHRYVSAFDVYEHTVLTRSFSKDLGIAGERIGYLVLHPSLAVADDVRLGLELSMRALGFVNAPATAQRALMHLESWDIDLAPYRERRDIVVDLARQARLEFAEPQGGLYLWIRSPWPDTSALIDELTRRMVVGVPGIAFGDPTHIRFCFSYAPDKLRMAVDALASANPPRPTARRIPRINEPNAEILEVQ